jgi:hypothetical protein
MQLLIMIINILKQAENPKNKKINLSNYFNSIYVLNTIFYVIIGLFYLAYNIIEIYQFKENQGVSSVDKQYRTVFLIGRLVLKNNYY